MTTRRGKTIILFTICLAAGVAAGCNLLVPIVFIGEHKRAVPAEFDRLAGQRIAVLVWAESATLFDYPHVRLELATYVGEKIAAGVENCDVVDHEGVEDYLERHLDAAFEPKRIGQQFEADSVVYIELLEFQIRDPAAPDLLRGRVSATVTVYDLRADPDETSRFVLKPVSVLCPEHQAAIFSSRNALLIRQQTYERFSEMVARKFFRHQVDL